MLKDNIEFVIEDDLTNLINYSLEKGIFPVELKLADISPIFKKNNNLNKENYRPIGVLGSSHQSCSMQKGALRNFKKFKGKRL